MRHHLPRGLTALFLLVGLAFAYAVPKSASRIEPGEAPSLEDELTRVHVEQDLMLAERTARMLDEFQTALRDWDDPVGDGQVVEEEAAE